jgi:hypothetical protein
MGLMDDGRPEQYMLTSSQYVDIGVLPSLPCLIPQDYFPDYAIAIFPADVTATVTCKLIGCNETPLTSSIVFTPNMFNASYVPANRSILITRQYPATGETVQTYEARLYNDSGYLQSTSFTSGEASVEISLVSFPPGNYYLTVVDGQGKAVGQIAVPVH